MRAGSLLATTCRSRGTSASSRSSPSWRSVADDAGLTLIELALAFVLEHPAVSAAIIGPRTMEQLESQLSAPSIVLEAAILDRLDEIVAPGTNVNVADAGWSPQVLEKPRLRRRHYR